MKMIIIYAPCVLISKVRDLCTSLRCYHGIPQKIVKICSTLGFRDANQLLQCRELALLVLTDCFGVNLIGVVDSCQKERLI